MQNTITPEIHEAFNAPAFNPAPGPACGDCRGRMFFVREVPDGDPNGTTVSLFECDDCGASEYID